MVIVERLPSRLARNYFLIKMHGDEDAENTDDLTVSQAELVNPDSADYTQSEVSAKVLLAGPNCSCEQGDVISVLGNRPPLYVMEMADEHYGVFQDSDIFCYWN